MGKNLRNRITDHFVNIFIHDVVAAVYDCWNHRYSLALSADEERRLRIAVGFSIRSNLTRNILFCIDTLDSIFCDDLTADLTQTLLEESPAVLHSKSLMFFVPLVAEYVKFSRKLFPAYD